MRRRLANLREYVAFLRSMQGVEREDFLRDPKAYGSVERFLQLSIEALNDIAAHIASELDPRRIETARDLAQVFLERGTIDAALARRWTEMTGFRNILVHDYLDVDRNIVFDVLQHRLADIEDLAGALASFL